MIGPGTAGRLPKDVEREVRSVVATYRDLFNASDARGLADLYAIDICFVNLGGMVFFGRQAILQQQVRGFDGPLDRFTISLEVESTRRLGEHHVLALIRQTIDDGSGSRVASTMTMVLGRAGGAWLVRHLQSTPVSGAGA